MNEQVVKLSPQERRVFQALRLDPLTPLKAWSLYGVTRLSAVIFSLRDKGFEIVSERIMIRNRYKELCPIAKYYLISYPPNID